METRGGKRTNAGRKKLPERKEGFMIYIEPSKLQLVYGNEKMAKGFIVKDIDAEANAKIEEFMQRNLYTADQCTDKNDVDYSLQKATEMLQKFPWSEALRTRIHELTIKQQTL